MARVLQESGDHTASRELLLFLGERSQELLQVGPSPAAAAAAANKSSSRSPHHHRRRLRFPLDNGGRTPGVVRDDDDRSWEGGGAGVAAAPVLPAATTEVMWRVARASMAAKDWATATLALRGLASEAAAAARPTMEAQRYYASFANGGGACSASPGPGRARVLRALAFCQVQRGMYRDALETVDEGLGGGGGGEPGDGDDAAMLMLRADALVSREREGRGVGWFVCWSTDG